MTPEQMARVSELFGQVLGLPAGERLEFLRKACPDDAAVRQEVEALLLHDQLADPGFLESGGGAGPAITQTVAATPGERLFGSSSPALHKIDIAGYTLTHELSRGGQGVVYQALQKSTKRKVAIKILLEGPYASTSARKRFEREVELIAQLKHPNVIAIFDSGTTADGHLFYVMDYVRGQPLSQYVRQKKPTLEEVLRLFATVCEAVQYAHQKGVIHRDLKPNNILVEADGTPKIMDFGLAKAMAGPVTTVVSLTQEVVGTLPYMSPEQARGNPDEVDTRTDVYALGVILYELLTGHYPYPVAGQIGEVLRHITETPPTPPSRCWTPDSGVLRREARKPRAGRCPIDDEVQTIVLRALAKERERRYQGAGELARDIGRYLAREPIEAKRDSGWYVLRTQLRRYKVPAVIVALFVVVVTTGFVTSAALWAKAMTEADRADRMAQQADQQRQLAEASAAESRAAETRLRSVLEAVLGLDVVMERLRATEHYERALPIAEAIVSAFPEDTHWLAIRAELLGRCGRYAEAIHAYEQVLEIVPDDALAANELAWLLLLEPNADNDQRREALDLMRHVKQLAPNEPLYDNTYALACAANGVTQEAEAAARRSLDGWERNPFDLVVLAICAQDRGDTAESDRLLREVRESDFGLRNYEQNDLTRLLAAGYVDDAAHTEP